MFKTSKFLASLGIAAAILTIAPAAFAQTVTSGSGVAGSATIAPGFTVLPVQNYDRTDDEIVQLNNLTIQNVVGNTIYASDNSSPCSVYQSANSYGAPIPCPLIARNVLYQISVGNDTILLLKNRARTSLSTFTVGDHINVFGFLDRPSQYMQALILRDLDKPTPTYGSYYTQFNNIRAITAPSPSYPPATMDVVFSPTPCALYSGAAGYRLNVACPYIPSGPSGVFMLAKHTVNIAADTVILNMNRVTMPLSSIRAEDTLNIFGRYNPSTGNIDAIIIRDLSDDGSGRGGIPTNLQVTVVDQSIVCIKAPCGLMPGVTVKITNQNTGANYSALTNSDGNASFGWINTGTYNVQAIAPDGRVGAATVYVTEVNSVTVYIGGNRVTAAPQIYSITPSAGLAGTAITLTGSGFASTGNIIHFVGSQYSAYIPNINSNGSTITFSAPGESSLACYYSTPQCLAPSYRLPPGSYSVSVENSNGTSNSTNFQLTP